MFLERGDIFFFYRPRVGNDDVEGFDDVQRSYIVLRPRSNHRYRLIVLGRKRLPEVSLHERVWGFVDMVAHSADELKPALEQRTVMTRTRGERVVPAAWPAGEGVYAIVRHDDHTHLAYALELPAEPGQVQHALNIEPEASYIVTVRNPDAPAPPGAGLSPRQRASFPPHLRQRFGNRRFIPLDPPELLDYVGAELVLISAAEDIAQELGVQLNTQRETLDTAEIFRDLRLDRSTHPLEPLLTGEWR
jgi:hypothetical protein